MESKKHNKRIYLSPPDQTGLEEEVLKDVLNSNWIAPVGPHLEIFENLICEKTGYKYAVALNSATAALHLSLLIHDVGKGDEVVCSSLTFCAAANAILYVNAKPVFIDSEPETWNIDLDLLEDYLQNCEKQPKAIIITHLFGMPTDMDRLDSLSNKYGFSIVYDLAEAIGGKFCDKKSGNFDGCGVLSFNGNKLITTGGGGAFLTNDKAKCDRVLYLSTQAKSKEKYYEHLEVGYNYRMSNVLAGIGVAQISAFEGKVNRKREIFNKYYQAFNGLPFIRFQNEPRGYFSDRWLTCILIDVEKCGISTTEIIRSLEEENIETRHVWKPMHLQPTFQQYTMHGSSISEYIFNNGICLPSGVGLSGDDQNRITEIVKKSINRRLAYQ